MSTLISMSTLYSVHVLLSDLNVVYQQQKAAPTTKPLNAVAIHHFVTHSVLDLANSSHRQFQDQLQALWNDVNHLVIPRNDAVQTLYSAPSTVESVSLIGSIPSMTSPLSMESASSPYSTSRSIPVQKDLNLNLTPFSSSYCASRSNHHSVCTARFDPMSHGLRDSPRPNPVVPIPSLQCGHFSDWHRISVPSLNSTNHNGQSNDPVALPHFDLIPRQMYSDPVAPVNCVLPHCRCQCR